MARQRQRADQHLRRRRQVGGAERGGGAPEGNADRLDGLDQLLAIADRFGQINVSLDGLGATYAAVRGFDGFARADAAPSRVPLVAAVERADLDAVRSLLKGGADVNAGDPDGTTALHWAARRDDIAAADLLLRAGADREHRDDRGGLVVMELPAA